MGGLFRKKKLSLLLLSKLLRDSSSENCGSCMLGTKLRPRDRTSRCVGLRVLDERFVIYLCLFINLCVSVFVFLRAFLLLKLVVLLLGLTLFIL